MDEVLLRIGEVAAFFGVSVKAMRIYERNGILRPARVDASTGYRYYTADQVQQLDAVLELRELGFSLAEIRKLLEGRMAKDLYLEALAHKMLLWRQREAQARDRIETIEGMIERVAASEPPRDPYALTEEERADLLSRMACLDLDLHALHGRNVLSEALWL